MTLSDFIEELNIAIRQDGHDIYCNASTAEIIKRYLTKQKKGKWIDDGTEFGCCCSECGTTLDNYFDGALYEICLSKIPNFCPNCGIKMER